MDVFDATAARALGIGRSDLRALNLLEDGPLSAGDVGARLHLTSGSVTTLIDRLLARGYVTRSPDPANRRRVLVELTSVTHAAFARVYRPLGERVIAATAGIPASQRAAAADALHRMADAFTAPSTDPATAPRVPGDPH